MREFRLHGFGRGAVSNDRPYRASLRVFRSLPSRPGEFHPEPLTDPDLILSHHPARAID